MDAVLILAKGLQGTHTVAIIIMSTVFFILGMNLALFINDTYGDTVSEILKKWSFREFFFLSFGWGVLFGHFFLGVEERLFPFLDSWWPVVLVLVLVGVLYLLGRFLKARGLLRVTPFWQLLLFVLGCLYGHYIWTQRVPEKTEVNQPPQVEINHKTQARDATV